MENQIIKLEQIPVIRHALEQVGREVTERIAALNIDKQVATEDTVKALKNLRAELNKELTEYEAQRKAVKEGVMNPYNEFEGIYKNEISDKYKGAIDMLKTQIDTVELAIKTKKQQVIYEYFQELISSEGIDFIRFEQLGLKIDLSTSEKKYKEQVNEFIAKIQDDIALISSETHQAEMMAEYKLTLNASKAITTVRERKEREKQEADRIKLEETQLRERILRGMNFIYRDITRTWEWIKDDSIFIKHSEVEEMTPEDFRKILASFESTIKSITEAERLTAEQAQPTAPAPAPAPQPVQAPTVAEPAPQAEIFTAEFRVEGSRDQLKALGAYMRENGIKYTNL